MKHLFLHAWLAAATFGVAADARAQAAESPVSWPAAVDAALQRTRALPEQQGRVQRAEAERALADRAWAGPPVIELDHRSGRSANNGSLRESEIGVAVPLWLPGQRRTRVEAASASLAAARRGVEAARWSVAAEVRATGLEVPARQAEVRQAELQVRLLRALAEDVERRVRAGDLARADAMAARAELLEAEVAQQDAVERLRAAVQRWRLLTGFTQVPEASPEPLAAGAPAADHPEVAAAELAVQAAQRRLQAVESARRDPLEVGARLRRDTDSGGSANSIGVSLRVPLGTADRPVQLAQARSDLELAQGDLQRTRERVAQDQQAARLQLEGTQRQLDAERARAGLLRQRADLIEKSFRAGDTGLPDLLRALAAAAQADAAAVRQQASLAQARARLSQSLGVFP